MGILSLFTYIFYQGIGLICQHHCFLSSRWTYHQRATGHISIGHNPKSSGSGGGAIRWFLHIYVVYCLFSPFILCAELWHCNPWTSKKSQWSRSSRHHVQIHGLMVSISLWLYLYITKIAFRTERSFVWHRVLALKICSDHLSAIDSTCLDHLTSNLNSLIFFDNYLWRLYLGYSFEIWTDHGFVQNPIWRLRFSDK